MKKRIPCLILPLVTLVLEILPFGAVCNFALPATDGSIGHFRELYSYFDLVPFGYANFSPFLTAVITCLILLLLLIYCLTGRIVFARTARNLIFVCATISFGPLVLGVRFFSIVGLLISASLIAEAVVLHRFVKASASSDANDE